MLGSKIFNSDQNVSVVCVIVICNYNLPYLTEVGKLIANQGTCMAPHE